MLYLDYSRNHGEWEPNIHGGRENLEAMAFLKETNEQVGGQFPNATTHAEESTSFPNVSRPTYAGGLGFHFKWNMGWMHDTLHFMQEDPINRKYHMHHMTFGMVYAYSENFVLPLSHDEVVYGKGSILGKMPATGGRNSPICAPITGSCDPSRQEAALHGSEFGQAEEWNHDQSLDWHLLEYREHSGVQRLVRDLNTLYRGLPALYENDCDPHGFEWVDTSNVEQSVLAYLRKDKNGGAALVVCNFTPNVHHGYRVGVPHGGFWEEVLNTDAEIYGGSNVGNMGGREAEEVHSNGRPFSLSLSLPRFPRSSSRPGARPRRRSRPSWASNCWTNRISPRREASLGLSQSRKGRSDPAFFHEDRLRIRRRPRAVGPARSDRARASWHGRARRPPGSGAGTGRHRVRWLWASPTLTVAWRPSRPKPAASAEKLRATRWASPRTSSRLRPATTATNSSPPNRAIRSIERSSRSAVRAKSFNTSSPIWCPCVSLMLLKWSRSNTRTETASPSRRPRAAAAPRARTGRGGWEGR